MSGSWSRGENGNVLFPSRSWRLTPIWSHILSEEGRTKVWYCGLPLLPVAVALILLAVGFAAWHSAQSRLKAAQEEWNEDGLWLPQGLPKLTPEETKRWKTIAGAATGLCRHFGDLQSLGGRRDKQSNDRLIPPGAEFPMLDTAKRFTDQATPILVAIKPWVDEDASVWINPVEQNIRGSASFWPLTGGVRTVLSAEFRVAFHEGQNQRALYAAKTLRWIDRQFDRAFFASQPIVLLNLVAQSLQYDCWSDSELEQLGEMFAWESSIPILNSNDFQWAPPPRRGTVQEMLYRCSRNYYFHDLHVIWKELTPSQQLDILNWLVHNATVKAGNTFFTKLEHFTETSRQTPESWVIQGTISSLHHHHRSLRWWRRHYSEYDWLHNLAYSAWKVRKYEKEHGHWPVPGEVDEADACDHDVTYSSDRSGNLKLYSRDHRWWDDREKRMVLVMQPSEKSAAAKTESP